MSAPTVAIVGSGTIGSTLAWSLARSGFDVTVFEKGPDYPYPHLEPFRQAVDYDYADPAYALPRDLRRVTQSGDCGLELERESVMRVGGSGTAWTALATRMTPRDFHVRTLYGFGDDWPIGYEELEPWMGLAEAQLGVAGTDEDNPWAPPRSSPYPLPPFALTPDDAWFADALAADGIRVHTTPQARLPRDYEGRRACMNFGECQVCPIGARYSPTHHLRLALATRRCRLVTHASVRRVVTDASGRARALLVRRHDQSSDREHAADVVIVACGAFESARLLLLSRDARHPDGLGNRSGHVGRHLAFHHIWTGHLHYRRTLRPGTVGHWTGQSDQFCDPPGRGRHGGVKIECPSRTWAGHLKAAGDATRMERALEHVRLAARCRQVGMHAESVPDDGKAVVLSAERDRHGDPFAHVRYDSNAFDRETHAFARGLFERLARATDAESWAFPRVNDFGVFAHYMGTTRMSREPADGVVDTFGAVHDTPGLYTIGLGTFVGSGGAVNPTLTGVALALRSAAHLAEEHPA